MGFSNQKYLFKLIGNVVLVASSEYDFALKRLIKAGILLVNVGTNTIEFSCQLAKRYFCETYYGNRASQTLYKTLQDLAIQAIQLLSARALQQSVVELTSAEEAYNHCIVILDICILLRGVLLFFFSPVQQAQYPNHNCNS